MRLPGRVARKRNTRRIVPGGRGKKPARGNSNAMKAGRPSSSEAERTAFKKHGPKKKRFKQGRKGRGRK